MNKPPLKERLTWLYRTGQPVNTSMGKAKVYSVTDRVVQVEFTEENGHSSKWMKFYLTPTYEHQLSVSHISPIK